MNLPERSTARPSTIPALVALAAAILLWSLADDWRTAMQPLAQQLNTAAALTRRGAPQELTAAQSRLADAVSVSRAIQARLATTDSAEMVRAQLNAELRQACLAVLATNCVVRLADDSLASAAPSAAPGKTPAPTATTGLAALGIQRARATVSAGFRADELRSLLQALAVDEQRAWRVNAVVVRGNTFEVDVERLVRNGAGEAKP
jgi:hypothetical protein